MKAIAVKTIAYGVAFLLAGTCIVAVLLWQTLPPSTHELQIPGLSATTSVSLDADGVPRIRAANMIDAATSLGYLHARDRMFQMDLMRRSASGRLSEIAGPATLPMDRMMRTLGLHGHASSNFEALPMPTRRMLEAYARGVNAWIRERGRFSGEEFLVIGTPEPWSPVDSLLWGETMAVWLSHNWRVELARLSIADKLPQREIDELWPQDRRTGQPHAMLDPALAGPVRHLMAALPDFTAPFNQSRRASNEWAVDGRHSTTGAPLLAGDPHLAFGMPGIWYLARIDTPKETLAGATAPGLPFLMIGHNRRIAWTFTDTGADVQDLFVETSVDGGYATPDGLRAFAVREERIHVRGQPDEILRVRETRHGPLISDLLKDEQKPLLALQAANLAPGNTAAAGLMALNQAQNVEEAARAAAEITSPVLNLLVADHDRIALYVTGRIPIRRTGDGSMPVPGADGAHDWIGWATGDELPHDVSPASGWLANANERIAPSGPLFLARDWFGDWRSRRIQARIAANERHTAADFAAMQRDVVSAYAIELLPVLLKVHPTDPTAARAVATLTDWDGAMEMDKPQPLIFDAWMQRFRHEILRRAGIKPSAAIASAEFIAFVLSPAGAHWCGTDCSVLLAATLTDVTSELAQRFGPDPSTWRWGAAHAAVFAHPLLSRFPVIGSFAVARIASPGDDSTVDRGSTGWNGLDSVHGPSYRGVYDLADLDRSLFVVAPGQSGHLLSHHAHDFLTRWRDGETILLGREAARVKGRIELRP
ncbi:penicillin acylase family protein [Bradyrhizobium lablabi]|uniref:penicillin acylase family protein n=1 Tax=Bradyrhizobium lablabi TaxID=722472 RepID=UPI001BADE03C|nr:penicillin acylase family protein [Bradyrhizobium lablabi]MBR0694611.1 penicillin acylase family protein [Bradyrhizobium lablabi]